MPPNTISDLEVGFPRLVSPWGREWGRLSPDTAACQELDSTVVGKIKKKLSPEGAQQCPKHLPPLASPLSL